MGTQKVSKVTKALGQSLKTPGKTIKYPGGKIRTGTLPSGREYYHSKFESGSSTGVAKKKGPGGAKGQMFHKDKGANIKGGVRKVTSYEHPKTGNYSHRRIKTMKGK